eukprot:8912289-Alexandrium_andersonii.AAC.1
MSSSLMPPGDSTQEGRGASVRTVGHVAPTPLSRRAGRRRGAGPTLGNCHQARGGAQTAAVPRRK